MAEKDNIQKYIQTYIQEKQGVYTRDAIPQKLVDAGYSINDIDYAYEALGISRGVEGKDKNNYPVQRGDWRNARVDPVGFLIFFPGLPILMFILNFIEPTLSSLVYLATLVGGMFVPMYVKRDNPSLAKGMIYGYRTFLVIFVCLPIVALVVLIGICMAGYSV